MEKRKFQRVPQDIATHLIGGAVPSGADTRIRIYELSAGGVSFESKVVIRVGDSVQFDIPLAVPVQATAKIVRSFRKGDTICHAGFFFGLRDTDQNVLNSYVTMQIQALGLKPLPED